MKDLITGHFRLMAIVFGCIYAIVAALVIIFGAYEGLIFLGIFTGWTFALSLDPTRISPPSK